jgi:hypothetical protein
MRILLLLTGISFFLLGSSCNKSSAAVEPEFDSIPVVKPLNPMISETSGIADSKANPGFLWAQEDSGNPPQLYLVRHDGTVVKTIYIKNAVNRDWEDIALAGNDLYIGDIGDNQAQYNEYSFYRFPEPASAQDTVRNAEQIRFRYPDGSHDAEAFLVDPATRDIYIITKQAQPSGIYRLAFPYSATQVNTAVRDGSLSLSGIVSATLSSNGSAIIVKTYGSLYQYKRSSGETIFQALQKTPATLPYVAEPQGEAVSFAINNSGYFTLSEKLFAPSVELRFYKRR